MNLEERDPATGMRMGEKLRTYFLGFGVGLILVGMIFYARYVNQQRRAARAPAETPVVIPAEAALPTGPR